MLRLLADQDGPPVTFTSVAQEAKVRLTNLYLYFPDMGQMLLAALARVMEAEDQLYLDLLRRPWPDEGLRDACLSFLRAHLAFWQRNARLLHMRNALADAGDLRVLEYRNFATRPLITMLARQMSRKDEADVGPHMSTATVLLTGVERLATVVTNPQFRLIADLADEAGQRAHVQELIAAEAEVLALAVAHRRGLA